MTPDSFMAETQGLTCSPLWMRYQAAKLRGDVADQKDALMVSGYPEPHQLCGSGGDPMDPNPALNTLAFGSMAALMIAFAVLPIAAVGYGLYYVARKL